MSNENNNNKFNPFSEAASVLKAYFGSSSSSSSSGNSGNSGLVFMDRAGSSPTKGSREILELYHNSPWLRATVSKIAQHYASVPWTLTRVRGKGTPSGDRNLRKLKTYPHNLRKSLRTKALDSDAAEEITHHPLLTLLDKANYKFGGNRLRSLTQKYMDLVGEFFWVIERNAKGIPVEIWPVPPTWIVKVPETQDAPYVLKWGQIERKIDPKDIVWFCDDNLQNPYGRGKGTGHSLADELDSDEYASQLIKTAFENRGLLDVVISVEGANQDQLDRARTQFANRHQGWLKAGVPFFHSGKADVKVVSQSFSEMQLLQLREFERDTIISIYGVPPEILGVLGKSNRATITESQMIMATEVLIPRLEYTRNVLNHSLVSQFGADLVLDFEDPTPGDDEFRLRAMQAHPYSATEREWRDIQGLDDRGDRDEFVLLPSGLYPLRGTVGASPQEGAQPKPPMAESGNEDDTPVSSGDPTAKAYEVTHSKASSIDIEAIMGAVNPRPFDEALLPLWGAEIKRVIDADLAEIESGISSDERAVIRADDQTILDVIAKYLREFSSKKIILINDTTRELVRATLAEGIENEESIPQLRNRITEVFDVSKARATVIARTEVVGSSNFATSVAMKASGIIEEKEWISTIDGRERESHNALNGKKVGIDSKFILEVGANAGASADHPGAFEIAEEDIQCRCTHWAVIPDIRSIGSTHHTDMQITRWKAFDARASEWEKKALPVIEKAFDDQRDAVLVKLGS